MEKTPSKKNTQFDKSTAERPTPSGMKGIPDKYKNHRKSSIPFADRSPQVRFIKATEEHSHLDIGSFLPHEKENAGKPILKKNSHPILVQTQHPEIDDQTNINWKIGNSAAYVEKVIQHFSSVERETRGSLDILTYPVSTSEGVEALARFFCGFTVTIICIEDLLILTAKHKGFSEFKKYRKSIQTSGKSLISVLSQFQVEAKAVLKRSQQRHKQWGKDLMGHGKFNIEERRSSIVPVYNNKYMPENVTLFENEIEEDKTPSKAGSRPDGRIQYFRTEGELAVMVEMKDSFITRVEEELDEKEVFCLIECLMKHAHELIHYATARLVKARDLLDDKIFDEELSTLKERIVQFETDAGIDPLCALDLKSTLAEVLTRKEELLNTSGHVVKYGDRMIHLLKMFMKYSKTVGTPKTKCWCGVRINSDKLFTEMNHIQGMDFKISMPISDPFIKDFCHMDLKQKESRVTNI